MATPYPFVLSYARKDSTIDGDPARPDLPFKTFVDRLRQRVDHLTGRQGFVDRTNILAGQEWPDELAEALRTAEAMVCLFSPSYFLSDYCGKEMQVLLDRRREYIRTHAGKKPANIIPVPWHPADVPKALPDFQYQAPGVDPRSYGVWNLGDEGKKRELNALVEQIALRVRDARRDTPLPELASRPLIGGVRSAFLPPPLPLPDFDSAGAAGGPDAVTFVYPSATQWNQWPWAPPDERAVLYLSAAVAKGRQMEPTQLVFDAADPGLITRLNAASQRNNVVILLVNAATLASDGMRATLQEYDRQEYARFATVVVYNDDRAPAVDNRVHETFRYFGKRTPPYFHLIERHTQLDEMLLKTLDELRIAAANDPHAPHRIQETTDFPNLPGLSGPGQAPA